jgi:hypothetical protein
MGQGGLHGGAVEDHDDFLGREGVYLPALGWLPHAEQVKDPDAGA